MFGKAFDRFDGLGEWKWGIVFFAAFAAVCFFGLGCGSSATGVTYTKDGDVSSVAEDAVSGDVVVDGADDGDGTSRVFDASGACLVPTPSQCKNDWDCTSPGPCEGNPKCITVWDGSNCARLCEYEDFCPGQSCYQNKCCDPSCEGKDCGDDGCGGTCGLCSGQDECIDGQCVCQPYCVGKDCGPDGCGGSCGTCEGQNACIVDNCVCQPYCAGKECGDDGCEGKCGVCVGAELCVENYCVCQPSCEGKECGDDGCGGDCGVCVGSNSWCSGGECLCTPDCTGNMCGDNGCGSSCGTCFWPLACIDNMCICQPSCDDKECGNDLCGGTCGDCGLNGTCVDGACCEKDCDGKNCGPDGCGGVCGKCIGENALCLVDQTCFCVSDCGYKDCGSDGCGGVCGDCPDGETCNEKQKCVPCEPDCGQPWYPLDECGPDGCGGVCGTCAANEVCDINKHCVCVPDCAGKECGGDGCDGSCGWCGKWPAKCIDGLCCEPDCEGKTCGSDGCGGICGACMGYYYCWEATKCVPEKETGDWICHNGEDEDKDGLTDCQDPDCEPAEVSEFHLPSFSLYYGGGPYPAFIMYDRSECSSGAPGVAITCESSHLATDVNEWTTWKINPPQCDGMTEAWVTVPSGNAAIHFSNLHTHLSLEVFYPAEPYPVRPPWDEHGVVVSDDSEPSWKVYPLGGTSQTVYVRFIGPSWVAP